MVKKTKQIIRTRFAPSPTGFLHIGSLRTALYTYLLAKQNNGQFVLRLEDTDTKRYVEGAEQALFEGLKWAGLQHDEGPDIGGPYKPYKQSERLDIYKKYAQELLDKDKAYYCFCDEPTLEAMRQEQTAKKQAPKYDGRCLKLSKDEVAQKLAKQEPHTIRMKIPAGRVIEINDLVRGNISYNSNELDDQILLKADGYPTYHLAVVADDHEMAITHVTRTEEWLPSTPKHILLYEYFGWDAPQWAHLPLLLNEDRTKMSKRKGDVAVDDYIKKGYLSEAMVNYLAFLGWNPGTEKEIYSMDGLLRDFSLAKVHKAGAVFNLEKLNWYNAQYLKQLPDEKLLAACQPYLPTTHNFNQEQLIKILNLEKERSANLSAIGENVKFFFELPTYDKALLKWKEMTDEKIKESLAVSKKLLAEISDENFTAENIKSILMSEAEKMPSLSRGKALRDRGELLWPLRVALAGQKNSPPPFEIAEILGKEEILERIISATEKLS